MIGEFVSNHMYMCSILLVGVAGVLLQCFIGKLLTDYVKASEQMDTTQKKNLLNLKNQFETIYGLECEVRNPEAYVDKYLLKLRFLGISYGYWGQVSYVSVGLAAVLVVGELGYLYFRDAAFTQGIELGISFCFVCACLFVTHHILGVRTKQEQIQTQLIDYLENYVTNRLVRGKKLKEVSLGEKMETKGKTQVTESSVEAGKTADGTEETTRQVAVAKEEMNRTDMERKDMETEETEADLLEEFVQSFLA